MVNAPQLRELATIFRIQEIFGLHPYDVQPTGSASFKVVILPLGFFLYIAHGVLFLYSLLTHYQLTADDPFASTPMSIAQDIVTANIHIVMYVFCFAGMTVNLRLLKKVSRLIPLLMDHLSRVGSRQKTLRLSPLTKIAMTWYCFGEIVLFGYYIYIKSPSVDQWLPDYSMRLVPSMSLQCSIWSYMMYVGRIKAFQDELNQVLLKVARSEMEGAVLRVKFVV